MTAPLIRLSSAATATARFGAAALGFSLPLSVALDNLLLVLVAAAWALSGQARSIGRLLAGNPVIACLVALAALHALGLAWTIADRDAAMDGARNGVKLMLVVVLAPLFLDPRTRARALAGFAAAMVLSLAVSWLVWLGVLAPAGWHKGTPGNPVAFKFHITHNLLMAFAAFLFALRARRATGWPRMLFAALALLAVANVLVLVQGRTGHVVVLLLAAYFFAAWLGWRGAVAGAAVAAVLAAGAWLVPGSTLKARVAIAVEEYRAHVPGAVTQTSIGSRIEFLRNGTAIVASRPLHGVGTGGFAAAYAAQVAGTAQAVSDNPHNEYLALAAQFGIGGALLFIAALLLQWWRSARIVDPLERELARGLVITFAAASMVSSTLMDHAEGLLFVWFTALLFASTTRGVAAERP